MSQLNDSERFMDDEEPPILPDHEYREARKTVGGREPTRVSLDAQATSEEQLLYAKILSIGMSIGLVTLLVTFALYVTGIVAPAVPIHELPNYWTLSAHDYLVAIDNDFLHREGLVVGWSWVALLNMGDYLNFVGIAFLALVTIVCYLGILPTLFRKKDWVYAGIAILEVLVLILAASGKVTGGH